MIMFGLSCLLVPSALSFHASAHLARVLPSRAGAAISMSGDRIPGPSSTVSGNDVTGIGVSKQLHGAVVTTQAGQTVEVLAPGIVIVRGALSESEQKFILHETNKLGSRDVNGFATSGTNGRGRLYEQCKVVPDEFTDLAIQSSLIASASDAAMPACSPTHVLINKYSTSAGLLWHRDIYSNDGDGDMPVINLSVGASCKFGISLPIRGAELSESRYLQLHSGDAIIFGGPSRFVKHAVLEVDISQKPTWMTDSNACRFSLTFREASSVLGREDFFRNFKVDSEWFDRTQSEWRQGDALVEPEIAEAEEEECVLPDDALYYYGMCH